MNIQDVKKDIPFAELTKDAFGEDYYYIPSRVITKRKAWNLLQKNLGFKQCLNKQYLQKGDLYIFNNHLNQFLTICVPKKDVI